MRTWETDFQPHSDLLHEVTFVTGAAGHRPQHARLRPSRGPDFALTPGSGRQAAGQGGPCPNPERSVHQKAPPPVSTPGLPAGLTPILRNTAPFQGAGERIR